MNDKRMLSNTKSKAKSTKPRDTAKRAARALKERCNGGIPCDRCKKSGHECKFSDSLKRPRILRQEPDEQLDAEPSVVRPDPMAFFEVERIRALEHIAQYFTGIEDCSTANLQQVIATFQPKGTTQPNSLSAGPAQCDEPETPDNIISTEPMSASTVGTWRGDSRRCPAVPQTD
ncbi:hypothetical protein QQX98_000855 [Neonectria punicea]|uniref:Zn(2)-C6 fungal-type domain-containing protein n=1 Tax=Neonectria punicea TaxID=979145 RepID=A0ABR1HS11_9HYPO